MTEDPMTEAGTWEEDDVTRLRRALDREEADGLLLLESLSNRDADVVRLETENAHLRASAALWRASALTARDVLHRQIIPLLAQMQRILDESAQIVDTADRVQRHLKEPPP